MEADTQDFPFVTSLPKRDKKKLFSLWDSYNEYRISIQLHGPPVTFTTAAALLGVSRQRIYQLKDRFTIIVAPDGTQLISGHSLTEYAQAEKVNGRPRITS